MIVNTLTPKWENSSHRVLGRPFIGAIDDAYAGEENNSHVS